MPRDMAAWRVQKGNDILDLTEEQLRKKLRKNDLSGAELARSADDSEWKPLHTLAIFKEEVAFSGSSREATMRRVIVPLIGHAAVFVAFGTFIFGWPWWMMFWGIGLVAHAGGATSQYLALRGQRDATGAAPAAKATPALASGDPLDQELDAAFAELAKAAASRTDIDVAGTRKAALVLQKQRAALLPLCDPKTRERLDAEQDRVMAEEGTTSEAVMKEALRQQALALQQRIDAIDEARSIAARLEARMRTVLHQVENLRLQIARASVDDTTAPSLTEDVRRIQREIAADSEAASAGRTPAPRGQAT